MAISRLEILVHCNHKIVEQGQFKYELAKLQKSTNNLLSCFGLTEENMDLSLIHLAVLEKKIFETK